MEDKLLVKWLKKDDSEALAVIIEKYSAYVSAVIINKLGSFAVNEDIEELASDVFFSLWANRKKLKSPHLRGWLGTAARNRAISHLRSLGVPETVEEDIIIVSDDTAAALAEHNERRRILAEALDSLDPSDREIFVRYYYHEQTTSAIAEALNIPAATVKTKLFRGRAKLRSILEKEGYHCEA